MFWIPNCIMAVRGPFVFELSYLNIEISWRLGVVLFGVEGSFYLGGFVLIIPSLLADIA